MIDHIGIRVTDITVAARFYDAVMPMLGYSRCHSSEELIGYGSSDAVVLWLHRSQARGSGVHIAFTAPDRRSIEAFHAAGLGAGGADNGAAGLRSDYGPTYFAAFLLDPEGNNVEAVCTREIA
jgi:catechol 2,3-dioxygenase-like lactoylglutathione lyase family enzyme